MYRYIKRKDVYIDYIVVVWHSSILASNDFTIESAVTPARVHVYCVYIPAIVPQWIVNHAHSDSCSDFELLQLKVHCSTGCKVMKREAWELSCLNLFWHSGETRMLSEAYNGWYLSNLKSDGLNFTFLKPAKGLMFVSILVCKLNAF